VIRAQEVVISRDQSRRSCSQQSEITRSGVVIEILAGCFVTPQRIPGRAISSKHRVRRCRAPGMSFESGKRPPLREPPFRLVGALGNCQQGPLSPCREIMTPETATLTSIGTFVRCHQCGLMACLPATRRRRLTATFRRSALRCRSCPGDLFDECFSGHRPRRAPP